MQPGLRKKFADVVLTGDGIGSLPNLAESLRCDTAFGITSKGWVLDARRLPRASKS